ncbi:diguanylate cyclase [Fundidesulfovibrio butyratiphilus]
MLAALFQPPSSGQSPRFAAIDFLPMGILAIDREHRIVFWNACLESWTGLERGAVLGRDLRQAFPLFAKPLVVRRVADLFAGGPPAIFSYHLHNFLIPSPLPGGGWRLQHSMAYGLRDQTGQVDAVVFSLQDVTEIHKRLQENLRVQAKLEKEVAQRKRMEVRLLELATVDMLTGVFNRRAFLRALSKEVRRSNRYGHALSLISLDIDHFKTVNDSFGHLTGDEVLRVVATVCAEEVRDMDTFGRVGGEEFAVVLPETVAKSAMIVAERICRRIADTVVHKDAREIRCTVSCGVAALGSGQSLEDLLHAADMALYEAKGKGRNRCVLASC